MYLRPRTLAPGIPVEWHCTEQSRGGRLMTAYCTIFCLKRRPQLAVEVMRRVLPTQSEIRVHGSELDWSQVTATAPFRVPPTSFTASSLSVHADPEKLRTMLEGMRAYFARVDTSAKAAKDRVLERIPLFTYALGVACEPEFDDEAGHFDCIWALATELDGWVWNGSALVDASGQMILDGSGLSEQDLES